HGACGICVLRPRWFTHIFRAQNRGIQLAAENEDRSNHVEKHKSNHNRSKARIGRNVIARELCKVRPERDASSDPQQEGQENARSYVLQGSSPCWQKFMCNDKSDQDYEACER